MKLKKIFDEVLSEVKRDYPSKPSVEFMTSLMNALNDFKSSIGYLEDEYKNFHKKVMAITTPLFDKTFGNDSPWTVSGSGGKMKIKWDKKKAKKLEIE